MTEIVPYPPKELEAVECAEGVALCRPDGTVVEWLEVDEQDDFDDAYCDICGDSGPWVDMLTGLCEMCWGHYGDGEGYDEDDSYD